MERSSMKSIDVGGVFLMDLSFNESESTSQADYQPIPARSKVGKARLDLVTTANDTTTAAQSSYYPYQRKATDGFLVPSATAAASTHQATTSSIAGTDHHHSHQFKSNHPQQQRAEEVIYRQSEYLGSSLDRLASVIDCDEARNLELADNHSQQQLMLRQKMNNYGDGRIVAMLQLQQQSPVQHHLKSGSNLMNGTSMPDKHARSSLSSSDESFSGSSDASLPASFIGMSENESDFEDGDKTSTTTREDSGVLDMKDLEGQIGGCRLFKSMRCTQSINPQQRQQNWSDRNNHSIGCPISTQVAENLISNSNKQIKETFADSDKRSEEIHSDYPHRSGKPTYEVGDTNHHMGQQQYYHQNHNLHLTHNYINERAAADQRRVSASVPIQVPTRQMRRDLNNMKLNLLREEQAMEQELALGVQEMVLQEKDDLHNNAKVDPKSKSNNNKSQDLAVFEDDDAFLAQEYNANHHNHYPISELGDEKLTAEDDPMKLFASIQALAKSLHEDAEIFGSLPPKRTLESPVRSMAFV